MRTQNAAERACVKHLQAQGYEVLKRGWPDFLAIRGDEVRFVEVKPGPRDSLSPNQRRVSRVLDSLGIHVELMSPHEISEE